MTFSKDFLTNRGEWGIMNLPVFGSYVKGGDVVEENQGLACCFTGHRKICAAHMRQMSDLLDRVLESLIGRNITEFRTGGAIGFDTVAALKVLEKRERYPHIRLHLYLPCRDQTYGWDEGSRRAYAYILSHADEVTCLREAYVQGCMLERNRKMVEGSHCCVGYCTSEQGGSAYTLRYAEKNGLRVINIAALMQST